MIELYYLMRKRRRYAPFSEWPMDKREREVHAAHHLFIALEANGGSPFINPRPNEPDPPDIVADLRSGGSCAIEVTELLDGQLASIREHVEGDPRYWGPGELTQEIAQRLTIKDRKPFHGGPYEATIVCLYTGEPLLSFDDVSREIACASFGPYHKLTAAYLLFRYDVELNACPIMELSFVA
jgi:hypothetical protein